MDYRAFFSELSQLSHSSLRTSLLFFQYFWCVLDSHAVLICLVLSVVDAYTSSALAIKINFSGDFWTLVTGPEATFLESK